METAGAKATAESRRAGLWTYGVPAAAFLAALMLLRMGLQLEKPALVPLLALAAPIAACMLFLDAFVLLCLGLAFLPWAIYVNVTDSLPVISFYFFSVLAAAKLLVNGGRQYLSPTLIVFTGYGAFLLASSVLMGDLATTKSKLFHWFSFAIFYFAAFNACKNLEKAKLLLTVLVGSMLANALFSIAIYYAANYAFPAPSAFLDSILFPVGKLAYGARGFDLILNGTNWFTESGSLKALGLFHNPTQTSLFALMSAGLSAFLLLDPRPLVSKGLLGANLAASLAHLILSSGRSGMVVAPVVIAIWIFALFRLTGFRIPAKNVAIGAFLLVLLGVALGNVIVMNFNSLVSLDYYSNAGRLVAMTSGLTVASYAGPFGFGFGSTPTVMDMGSAVSMVQQQISSLIGAVSYSFKSILADEYYRQTNYHSLYMDLIVQTGYVGFLIFLGVFAKIGWVPKRGHPALAYACLAVVAAFTLAQVVGGDIFYPKVMIPLLAIAALAERMNSREFTG